MASDWIFFWNDVFLLGTGFQVKIFQIEHFSGNPAGRGRIVEINGGIWQNYVKFRRPIFWDLSVAAWSLFMLEPFILPCARPKFEVQTTSSPTRVTTHLRTLQYFINAIDACRSFPSTQFCFKQLLFPVQNAFLTFILHADVLPLRLWIMIG